MKRRRKDGARDPAASMLHDGEGAEGLAARAGEPAVVRQLADFRRLSRLLWVPDPPPDPFFVARFRRRRDELRAAVRSAQPWRWVAVRLVPLAASALLVAGLVVFASGERPNSLAELELRELGDGVADVTFETTEVEPVLRIAFGEL